MSSAREVRDSYREFLDNLYEDNKKTFFKNANIYRSKEQINGAPSDKESLNIMLGFIERQANKLSSAQQKKEFYTSIQQYIQGKNNVPKEISEGITRCIEIETAKIPKEEKRIPPVDPREQKKTIDDNKLADEIKTLTTIYLEKNKSLVRHLDSRTLARSLGVLATKVLIEKDEGKRAEALQQLKNAIKTRSPKTNHIYEKHPTLAEMAREFALKSSQNRMQGKPNIEIGDSKKEQDNKQETKKEFKVSDEEKFALLITNTGRQLNGQFPVLEVQYLIKKNLDDPQKSPDEILIQHIEDTVKELKVKDNKRSPNPLEGIDQKISFYENLKKDKSLVISQPVLEHIKKSEGNLNQQLLNLLEDQRKEQVIKNYAKQIQAIVSGYNPNRKERELVNHLTVRSASLLEEKTPLIERYETLKEFVHEVSVTKKQLNSQGKLYQDLSDLRSPPNEETLIEKAAYLGKMVTGITTNYLTQQDVKFFGTSRHSHSEESASLSGCSKEFQNTIAALAEAEMDPSEKDAKVKDLTKQFSKEITDTISKLGGKGTLYSALSSGSGPLAKEFAGSPLALAKEVKPDMELTSSFEKKSK